jgi:LCP family protein required for cell wall assembly
VNQVESTLRQLADDPFVEPAPAGLADRALTRARERTRHRGALAVVGALSVALMAIGATATAQHRFSATPAAPTATFAKPRMNLLLIGTDEVPGRAGVRAEVIRLASIDSSNGNAVMFTLPAVTRANPGGAEVWPKGFDCPECDLGGLWSWAKTAPAYMNSQDPGLKATTEVVEKMTKLQVDDSVVLGLDGLKDVVNAVGGVHLKVNQPVPIGGSPDRTAPDYHQARGWIEPGTQRMDGDRALAFVRARWNRGEDAMVSLRSQTERQGCVLSALIEQQDARGLPAGYPRLAKRLGSGLSSSIGPDELAPWGHLLHRTQGARVDPVLLEWIGFPSLDPKSLDSVGEFQERVRAAIAHQSPDPNVAWAEENVPSVTTSSEGVCQS